MTGGLVPMVNIKDWVKGMSSTEKLYLVDSYLRECSSVLLDFVCERGSRYYVVLDRSIFHPRGGGQPCDTGWLVGEDFRFSVKKVLDVNGVLVHYGRIVDGEMPSRGSLVKCILDWDRRYRIMRLHTAGHVIDYAVNRVYGHVVETLDALHGPPKPYIVYNESPPSENDLRRIEALANQVVMEKHPVEIYFASRDELEDKVIGAPNIDRLPYADKYRIVSIKGVNAIPCTGTHVRNTGEIGRIIIHGVEVLDRGFKLFYDVS
ncbi:MAG: hypothetical protein DRO40_08385 [Thermoprotei archaeon]|nr:MAG: hypothetical protein DRO40_08385 [Thermoprotei archaeon]